MGKHSIETLKTELKEREIFLEKMKNYPKSQWGLETYRQIEITNVEYN